MHRAKFYRLFVPIIMFAALGGFLQPLSAAIPSTFTYQGSLKQNGAPVNGSYTMEFRLTNQSGSALYWTSGSVLVDVKEGLYRVDLAPTGVDWVNTDPYIETRVSGNTLLPRERLTTAPYAWTARDLVPNATLNGNVHVIGALQVDNGIVVSSLTAPGGGTLRTDGLVVMGSTYTSGTATFHGQPDELLNLSRTGNNGAFLRISNPDTTPTTGILNGFVLSNLSNSIYGSVAFSKYANGYSGNDDAGVAFSNSARFTIGRDNIARWVWTMGTNNANEGIYFEGGSPNEVKARLDSGGSFYSKGLGVNTFNLTEPTDLNGRTKITAPIAPGNNSGDWPYRGALRVIGTSDQSNGRLCVLQAPWISTYQTDRIYLIGYNASGTANFYIRGDGTLFSSSSRQLKEDITPVPDALNKINQLTGVRYKWKGDETGKHTLGFIAEDLAKVVPDAVEQDRYVNYSGLVPVLVESIKELTARVEDLQSQLNSKGPSH